MSLPSGISSNQLQRLSKRIADAGLCSALLLLRLAETTRGLDEQTLSRFRQRAIPSPERVTRDVQRLFDTRRYGVPATVICTEFSADTLREWIKQGEEAVQEITKIRTVEYTDLPTGHWPQFSQPQQLAEAILRASLRPAS